jgi:hypothetical protein
MRGHGARGFGVRVRGKGAGQGATPCAPPPQRRAPGELFGFFSSFSFFSNSSVLAAAAETD